MSQAASQAWAFYREVARTRLLWTIRDDDGFPAPKTEAGRAMPFWSSRSRVERVIATVPSYSGFRPAEVPWAEFCSRWIPGLTRDGVRVGVNWSGPRARGYDLEPEDVRSSVEALIDEAPQTAPEDA